MDPLVRQRFETWRNDPYFDEETRRELEAIRNDPAAIEDRFYQELSFGTGGMRGVLGAGTNRMNRYIVRKAAQGLADFIQEHGHEAAVSGVVIAHDCRHRSREFALESARVLAANGVTVHLFDDQRPTPALSFAVRHRSAIAGIVITASHNPPEYNGFKVYWEDGAQVSTERADAITAAIRAVAQIQSVRLMPEEQARREGLLRDLGTGVDEAYLEAVLSQSLKRDVIRQMTDQFRVVYTPLHGTGAWLVPEALKRAGFEKVWVEPSQARPDPNFSTVASPNPEEKEAFQLAMELAEQVKADLIIGTDPDGDRVGAVVKNPQGEYVVLTGNQTGALLVEYLLRTRWEKGLLPSNGLLIKTIVTSEMGAKIARAYGVEVENTLTGFKYIGDRIRHYETTGEKQFLFGYEESYGYLAGTHARDKDAVVTSLLIAEMAADYARQGLSLFEGLLRLYETYGCFQESLRSLTMTGRQGMETIEKVMATFRNHPPEHLGTEPVTRVEDYRNMPGFPAADVLKWWMGEKGWVALRPSGTEPKLKIYGSLEGPNLDQTQRQLSEWMQTIEEKIRAVPPPEEA